MLTLYDYLPSQNAWKVRLLLRQLDIAYRSEIVSIFEGEGERDAYRAINPSGAVPALRLDDGRCLAESNAILFYLADGSDYLPDDVFARAKVLQWLNFEADTVQSTVATLRHWVMTGKDRRYPAQLVEMKRRGSARTLSILDRELARSAFLANERYSIADISVFAYVHRADEAGVGLADYPHLLRWVDDVSAQPRYLAEVHPYSIDPYSSRDLP